MNKILILLFFIFLALFALAYQIGSMSVVGEEEADMFMEAFKIIADVYNAPEAMTMSYYNGPTTNTIAARQPLADKLRIEMLIKYIMGEEDLSTFDDFAKQWMKAGGADLTEEINTWYKNK